MIAAAITPAVKPYLIAAHRSQERGHGIMLDWLGLSPLLDFDLRLGEGTGAALGISLAEAAWNTSVRDGDLRRGGSSGWRGGVDAPCPPGDQSPGWVPARDARGQTSPLEADSGPERFVT